MDLGIIAGVGPYIGLPPGCVTIRNSQRTTAACPRRWLFREGEGLRPVVDPRALSFGSAFHQVMEEIHKFWMRWPNEAYPGGYPGGLPVDCPICWTRGCASCNGTGVSAMEQIRRQWGRDPERKDDIHALEQIVSGWMEFHGKRVPHGVEVVGVELPIAMPVLNAAGRVYTTDVWIVADAPGRWRRALLGEALTPPAGCAVHRVRIPVYLVGTLDVVWRDLNTGNLYVGEHKTSRDPARYLGNMSVDPQVATYELLLGHAVRSGLLSEGGPTHRPIMTASQVAGHRYLVSSSMQIREPEVLKDGMLTKNKGKLRNVPSWVYRDALRKAGQTSSGYEDILFFLEVEVDQRRYREEHGACPGYLLERTSREITALARAEAGRWRAAATLIPGHSRADIDFPRVPVCRSEYSGCPYRVPCEQDDGRFARGGLCRADPLAASEVPGDEGSDGDVPDWRIW